VESGLSYSILRPAVLFGREDILINNIAWFLRKFPVFGVFGDGSYRLQPIYVEDLARLAVDQGESSENNVIDAIGPETFTFRELVQTIGKGIGKERPIVSIPPSLGLFMAKAVGLVVNDVVLTRDEIRGLMDGRLFVDQLPTGPTRLTDWISEYAGTLGKRYTNELRRRKDRTQLYASN
jgi:nucleoside-diphosphate-sugar epimerase